MPSTILIKHILLLKENLVCALADPALSRWIKGFCTFTGSDKKRGHGETCAHMQTCRWGLVATVPGGRGRSRRHSGHELSDLLVEGSLSKTDLKWQCLDVNHNFFHRYFCLCCFFLFNLMALGAFSRVEKFILFLRVSFPRVSFHFSLSLWRFLFYPQAFVPFGASVF